MTYISRYKHFYTCPKCDCVYSWVDSYTVSKKSTWENSCFNCGFVTMKFYKTVDRKELLK